MPDKPPILPIEYFKTKWELNTSFKPIKVFLSSGTQGERSQSPFSREGLDAYKEASKETFKQVIQAKLGQTHSRGFSLIPRPKEWPDSSLAAMMDFLSEDHDVTFVEQIPTNLPPDHPIWIFGTAFHFVNLHDQGFRLPLPKGSVVFETGGTKNKSRELSRQELFDLISLMFGIPHNDIISEYSMSELASQAYDFVPPEAPAPVPLSKRTYRFPHWVELEVDQGLGVVAGSGSGAILIRDERRIDFAVRLQTQDLARLCEDGSFQLLGRIPKATLKGCSSLVKTSNAIRKYSPKATTTRPSVPQSEFKLDWQQCYQRANAVIATIKDTLDKNERRLFANEFSNANVVAEALREVAIPTKIGPRALAHLACESFGSSKPIKDWAFILPRNHSLAGYKALVFATVLGLKVTVRIPQELANSFIATLANDLSQITPLDITNESFRISDIHDRGVALLGFGSQETIKSFQQTYAGPQSLFGHVNTAVLVRRSQLHDPGISKDILARTWCLDHKGCLSVRAIIILDDDSEPVDQFIATLAHQSKAWISKVELGMRLALDRTQQILAADEGCQVAERKAHESPVIYLTNKLQAAAIPELTYVLPIVLTSEQELVEQIAIFDFLYIADSCDPKTWGIKIATEPLRRSGHWTCEHVGKGLFTWT